MENGYWHILLQNISIKPMVHCRKKNNHITTEFNKKSRENTSTISTSKFILPGKYLQNDNPPI